MSQWTALQLPRSVRTHHPASVPTRRPQSQNHDVNGRRSGYTIAHAGRQIRFGPVVFWIAVGTVVIMAGWSVTTATYFAFRDDVLKGLMARQAAQQDAYEDRIAELRAQIDRTTSRQLLDQDRFEQKLDELARRQAILEQRATALGDIADPGVTGSIKPGTRGSLELTAPQRMGHDKQSSVPALLDRIDASLAQVDQRETMALEDMQTRYQSRAEQLRHVVAQLGLKRDAMPDASGGPFVPVRLPPANQPFARALTEVSIARAQDEELTNGLGRLPLRKPLSGEIELSSPFGVRVDPFLHVAAMHTGMDFRGELGEPILATAAGTVTIAGWTGGYGKMIEIDHGNGLSTRYGHLSEIDVDVGQHIRAGQVIGRLGSTGRSTGPHLHYETRIDGEPVNPERFLAAGAKLFGYDPVIVPSGHTDVQD